MSRGRGLVPGAGGVWELSRDWEGEQVKDYYCLACQLQQSVGY